MPQVGIAGEEGVCELLGKKVVDEWLLQEGGEGQERPKKRKKIKREWGKKLPARSWKKPNWLPPISGVA